MAGDAIGVTEPLSSITTPSFRIVRRSRVGEDGEDSATLELRADMKGSTTLVPRVGMKDPTAPELSAGMEDPAAETSVAMDFTAARPSVGLQSRTPKLARIPARLEGMTTVARPTATRTAATRACTAAAVFMRVVFTEEALAAAVD
jgi:hypothetical protein